VIVEAAKGEGRQPYIIAGKDGRMIFVMGHLEYDADTLKEEYERDKEKREDVDQPKHYSTQNPSNEWRSHGYLLYSNWLNYYVYQTTPFDLETAQSKEEGKR
jgi:homoserine O-succinyltransferase